jgi:hypothetical protein
MLRSLFVSMLFLLSAQLVFAQEFEVPDSYKFKKKEDYIRYEKEILSCITWLESTPFDVQDKKRRKACDFLLKWLDGNPVVKKFEPSGDMQVFNDKNPELLVIFMGGWARYCLEHPESADNTLQTNMAGILSVIKVYKLSKGNGIKKDKNIETLVKLWEKGDLEAWVKKTK